MKIQTVFRRRELKYMLTRSQQHLLLKIIAPYMHLEYLL